MDLHRLFFDRGLLDLFESVFLDIIALKAKFIRFCLLVLSLLLKKNFDSHKLQKYSEKNL